MTARGNVTSISDVTGGLTLPSSYDNAVRKIAIDNEFRSMVTTAVNKYEENTKRIGISEA